MTGGAALPLIAWLLAVAALGGFAATAGRDLGAMALRSPPWTAPPFLAGAAFGIMFAGTPLHPFVLLSGLVGLAMIMLQGSRAPIAAAAYAALFMAAGFWLLDLDGGRVTSTAEPKTVAVVPGAWLFNFYRHPALWLLPLAALIAAGLAVTLRPPRALVASALVPVLTIATAGAALFPFIRFRADAPDHSLTVRDASSSMIAFGVVALVLAGWAARRIWWKRGAGS